MGRKGRKQRYTAQRLFKQEKLEKRGGKSGNDGSRYRREIFVPVLYPFYDEVQAEIPDVMVWLIEENAPSRTRAARQCKEDRRLRNIQKCERKLLGLKGAIKEAQGKARLEGQLSRPLEDQG